MKQKIIKSDPSCESGLSQFKVTRSFRAIVLSVLLISSPSCLATSDGISAPGKGPATPVEAEIHTQNCFNQLRYYINRSFLSKKPLQHYALQQVSNCRNQLFEVLKPSEQRNLDQLISALVDKEIFKTWFKSSDHKSDRVSAHTIEQLLHRIKTSLRLNETLNETPGVR